MIELIEKLKDQILKKTMKDIDERYQRELKSLTEYLTSFPKTAEKRLKSIKDNEWTFYILEEEEFDEICVAFRTKRYEAGYTNDVFTESEHKTFDFITSVISDISYCEVVECTYGITNKESVEKQLLELGLVKGTPAWK